MAQKNKNTAYELHKDKNSKEHLGISIHRKTSGEGKEYLASSNITPMGETYFVSYNNGKIHSGKSAESFEDAFKEAYNFLTKNLLSDRKFRAKEYGEGIKNYSLDCKIRKNRLPAFQKNIVDEYHRKLEQKTYKSSSR